jgi:hypothetical protein
MIREFYDSEAFAQLPVMPYALPALQKLAKNNTLYIITGRQDIVRDKTETWVETHFPGVFKDVILTNSYTPYEVQKVDVCHKLNIGLLIDDNIQACADCIDQGVDAFNFIGDPVYPWCFRTRISLPSWKDILLESS